MYLLNYATELREKVTSSDFVNIFTDVQVVHKNVDTKRIQELKHQKGSYHKNSEK